MLNLKMGRSVDLDGRPWIATAPGRRGFALYGPYVLVRPGEYAVEFLFSPSGDVAAPGEQRALVLEVVSDEGRRKYAERVISGPELAAGMTRFLLPFRLEEAERLEFRAWVSGETSLLLADQPRVLSLAADEAAEDALALADFPAAAGQDLPFFRAHEADLRRLFDEGARIRIEAGRVRLRVRGIWLNCDSLDDLAFVGEVFREGAYNFLAADPVCAIDIGMNVGLSSLLFASKPEVRRVHSFEPFRATFDRAIANLDLNPRLAARIQPYNIGLSDRDHDGELRVTPVEVSGAANVIEVPHGEPVHLVLRDAGAVLAPMIGAANAAGERVIVKVDCEGSEYAVFESLERRGLLGQVDAFMVEWHAMFESFRQERLIDPLRAAGFLVFDRSPAEGNGFFYAVRLGGRAA